METKINIARMDNVGFLCLFSLIAELEAKACLQVAYFWKKSQETRVRELGK